MTNRKFPPRGYKAEEFPLHHSFTYKFSLNLTDVAQDATIVTLLRNSTENTTNPEAIEVNPHNASFAECNGPLCHPMSIIPKMTLSMNCFQSEASALVIDANKDNKGVLFNWMPIYTAFADSIDAVDDFSGATVGTILELAKGSFEEISPIFVADLDNAVGHGALHPLTTQPNQITDETFDDYELGTDTVMEHVAFDKDLYFDIMRFGTNAHMLRKVAPRIHSAYVSPQHPWTYYSKNFTYPTVKRINPFTFCGILFSLPQAGSTEQLILDSEITDIEHLFFSVRCSYDEWNPGFDQVHSG